MRLSRLSTTCAALALIAGSVPLWTVTAQAASTGPVLLLVADQNGDGTRGLYRTTGDAPLVRTAVLPDNDQVDVAQARLSPDGSRIAALVDPTGYTNAWSLQVMNLDGSGRRTLFAGTSTSSATTTAAGFDWAPDGSAIAFGQLTASASGLQAKLLKVPVSGTGSPVAIAGGAGAIEPSFDPSGGRLAVVVLGTTFDTVAKIDLNTGARTTLFGNETVAPSEPTWTPDGTRVVLSVRARDGWFGHLASVAADTGTVHAVTQPGAVTLDSAPAFAADGSLWFSRFDEGGSSLDLYSTIYDTQSGTWLAPTQQTATADSDEDAPAFGPRDTTPPGAAVFTPFTLASTSITLRWTNPSSVDFSHVVVVRDDGLRIYAGRGTSAVDTHAVLAQTHQYAVVAFDGAGNASPAATRAATAFRPARPVVPNPTSNAATGPTFPVSWGNGNPAGARYTVQWSYKTGTSWSLVAPRSWLSGTTLTSRSFGASSVPTTVGRGQTYYLRAVASDAYGNSSAWSGWAGAAVPLNDSQGRVGPSSTSGQRFKEPNTWYGDLTQLLGGESLSFAATSKGFSVIGARGIGLGYVKVYVNGKLVARVNTASSTWRARSVLWSATYSTIASRTVKLVADPTSNGVLVDGLAIPR